MAKILSMLTAAALFAGCCCTENSGGFELSQNRAQISRNAAEQFSVVLESNPTTGYGWNVSVPSGVNMLAQNYIPDNSAPNLCGAGGIEKFDFVVPQKGSYEIKFEYRRPWEKNVPALHTRTLQVDAK